MSGPITENIIKWPQNVTLHQSFNMHAHVDYFVVNAYGLVIKLTYSYRYLQCLLMFHLMYP